MGARATWTGRARWICGAALDALLPPQCLGCSAAVDDVGRLCADCWAAVQFIAAPHCTACGLPFEFEMGDDALCGACVAKQPVYRRARAVMRYDDGSRDLVLGFKHADRTEAAPAFGRWLARAGADLLGEADVIAPVPLNRWRLLSRRYNQAALLALAVGREAGLPVAVDLLARTRRTPSQAGLGREARRANLRGAFAVHSGRPFEGARVLLVDDVMTTGATVEACTRTLLRAGAASVDVLTLARVVRPAVHVI